MTPQDTIETISDAMHEAEFVRALFLSGSYGTGLQDEFSDLDFLAIVEADRLEEFAAVWRKSVEQVGLIVLWWDRRVKGTLINAITKDWLRIDVVAGDASQLSNHARDKLRMIFDKDDFLASLPETRPSPQLNAERLFYDIQEFIRIMGLLPLAIGRNEMVNAVTGLSYLRRILIDFFIADFGATDRGGALNLNRLITPDQNELLRSLPPLVPERAAVIEGYLAYAKAFLPTARKLAERHGIEWPAEFEAATWVHLEKTLGVSPVQAVDP
jgi:Nucleotidyltransferase domain